MKRLVLLATLLTVCAVCSAQRFSVSAMDSSVISLKKGFDESIACFYSLNGKPEKEKVICYGGNG